MVYDHTDLNGFRCGFEAPTDEYTPRGFAIFENPSIPDLPQEHTYALYTDDGRGNGDYICGSSDLFWIRKIAYALDEMEN